MSVRGCVLVGLGLLCATGLTSGAPLAATIVSTSRGPVELEPERFADQVVELTNEERAKRGLPPLALQPNLHQAARWLAQDMAARGYLDHTDSSGRYLAERLHAFGYGNANRLAENIAVGPTTPREAVHVWMQSDRHRDNVLNKDLREIGVGYAINPANAQMYWVQDFGTRFDAGR